MLEERFLKIFQNNVDDQYNELNKFLSSSVEFSDIDIDFFLNKISNNTILRVLCTDSFLSSESRILSVIRYCEKNPQMIYPLVKGIKSAIRPPKLTFAKFIFKNFPFHFLKDEMRDGLDLGFETFKLGCIIFQKKEITSNEFRFESFDNDITLAPYILMLSKQYYGFFYSEEYKECIIKMKKNIQFKNFINEKFSVVLSKFKSLIKKKDIFLQMRIEKIVHHSFSEIKENYNHFILKKIVLPRIKFLLY